MFWRNWTKQQEDLFKVLRRQCKSQGENEEEDYVGELIRELWLQENKSELKEKKIFKEEWNYNIGISVVVYGLQILRLFFIIVRWFFFFVYCLLLNSVWIGVMWLINGVWKVVKDGFQGWSFWEALIEIYCRQIFRRCLFWELFWVFDNSNVA